VLSDAQSLDLFVFNENKVVHAVTAPSVSLGYQSQKQATLNVGMKEVWRYNVKKSYKQYLTYTVYSKIWTCKQC